MNIIDTISARRSVRTFDGTPLSPDERAALSEVFASTTCPFGDNTARMRIITMDAAGDFRPGTYGMIKGARDYCLLGYGPDDKSAMAAGYRFEAVVLAATQMSLGTCWLGGTFRPSTFGSDRRWPGYNRTLQIVCPVGHGRGMSIMDRLARLSARSDRRRPFGELFFDSGFDTPLTPEGCNFGTALEMMRLAPSSTNSQPWRALVSDNKTVHFYAAGNGRFRALDCGIGLYHFTATERHSGHHGIFFTAPTPPLCPTTLRYVISYRRG